MVVVVYSAHAHDQNEQL